MSKIFDALTKDGRIFHFDTAPVRRPVGQVAAFPNGFPRLDIKPGANARLVFHTEPAGLAAEQYRMLRRRVAARFPEGGTLLVTSPAPGDGKTLSAINLAWCLAEGNWPTLLLEADLRRPSVARLLGCSVNPGVEEAFAEEVEPEAIVRKLGDLPLYVAMAAKERANAASALVGIGPKKVLHWAKSGFRWVVVDTPPVLPVADVGELSSLTDAVFLVVRARATERDLLLRSIEMLGNRLQGIIFNDATACSDSYYRYAGDYHRYYTKQKI